MEQGKKLKKYLTLFTNKVSGVIRKGIEVTAKGQYEALDLALPFRCEEEVVKVKLKENNNG